MEIDGSIEVFGLPRTDWEDYGALWRIMDYLECPWVAVGKDWFPRERFAEALADRLAYSWV